MKDVIINSKKKQNFKKTCREFEEELEKESKEQDESISKTLEKLKKEGIIKDFGKA